MDVRIDLTDRHKQHPDNVREYATEKVQKLTRYFDKVQHIEIVLDHEHGQHSVEVIVTANHQLHFVGHASHDSALACIDSVVEKLERQVVKAKERLKDHHRGEAARRQL
ncbi:MAG: hypothetical protein DHS20C15_22400 [Planctomycetota bacterium]|nr:MAG: hypothetical protein DHS20C15_22400 [Planctomycetota bacterium]